jgi:hypothetical protein
MRDPAEALLATGGPLSRSETKPRGEFSTRAEQRCVTDRRDYRGRDQWTNAEDPRQSLADWVCPMPLADLSFNRCDLLLQRVKLIDEQPEYVASDFGDHVLIEMSSQPSHMPNALGLRYTELCH